MRLRKTVSTAVMGVLVLIGTALVTAEPTIASPPVTCTDPRTGVPFNATVVGTDGPDIYWARPGDVIATLGGDDSVFTDFASPNVVVCLGDGADYFGPSVLGNVISGGFGVRGEGGRDILMGGAGADYLVGGGGRDIHLGNTGYDRGDAGEDVDLCDVEEDTGRGGSCEFQGIPNT